MCGYFSDVAKNLKEGFLNDMQVLKDIFIGTSTDIQHPKQCSSASCQYPKESIPVPAYDLHKGEYYNGLCDPPRPIPRFDKDVYVNAFKKHGLNEECEEMYMVGDWAANKNKDIVNANPNCGDFYIEWGNPIYTSREKIYEFIMSQPWFQPNHHLLTLQTVLAMIGYPNELSEDSCMKLCEFVQNQPWFEPELHLEFIRDMSLPYRQYNVFVCSKCGNPVSVELKNIGGSSQKQATCTRCGNLISVQYNWDSSGLRIQNVSQLDENDDMCVD